MAAAAAAEAAADSGMTVMSRVERLDMMLACLEEIKAGGSRQSSFASTTTSSGGRNSSSSPRSGGCRSLEEVVAETQLKGSLIDRILFLESRLLKLEEGIENERKREMEEMNSPTSSEKKKHKRGLKSIVKSCVGGDHKTKD